MTGSMEIVCPAGTPAALRTAVNAGADCVYLGFRDETNARNFPGLNFSREELAEALRYAHEKGAKILLAVNTFARAGDRGPWKAAIDDAARMGVDAVIVADMGVAAYAAETCPELRLHLSVQASASTPEAIHFYCREFGVKRVVLPRVLSVPQITDLKSEIDCEIETFVFGGLCVMAEGRCSLSSYATGESPNMNGVCSPASHVSYREDGSELVSRLGDFTINRFAENEPAGYPTLCKGCFRTSDQVGYIFEEPKSLNAAPLLAALRDAGVTAVKIEGRQRSRSYVRQVVEGFRAAIDALDQGHPLPTDSLLALTEGQAETEGAYKKTWR